MNRYLTTSDSAGNIQVFRETDDYKSAIDNAEEWVWQYAPDRITAKNQHSDKHDHWSEDQIEGREEKTTY